MYKLYRQKQRSRQQIDFRENKIWGIDVIASQKHCFSDSWKGEAIQKMTVIYSRGNVKHSLASSVNHNQNMFCLRVEEMYKKKNELVCIILNGNFTFLESVFFSGSIIMIWFFMHNFCCVVLQCTLWPGFKNGKL